MIWEQTLAFYADPELIPHPNPNLAVVKETGKSCLIPADNTHANFH